MDAWLHTLLTVLTTVIASSGFWTYMMRRCDRNNIQARMLVGLAHDRIVYLGLSYIERGWITHDEYENLNDYLFKPYTDIGGNGTAAKVMGDVAKLPIRNMNMIINKEDIQ